MGSQMKSPESQLEQIAPFHRLDVIRVLEHKDDKSWSGEV